MKKLLWFTMLLLASVLAFAADAPMRAPEAVVDLATTPGAKLLHAEWRYADAKVIEADFLAPGANGQPGTLPVRTYDIEPHAGAADYNDATWPVIAPESLAGRRGNGRLSFGWYRLAFTVPERVGPAETKGATLVFKTALDDYAEIWVNGELARHLGQTGGSVIAGWNAENAVILARNILPGQKIQVAVFGANGPLSDPPTNYLWVRYAKLEVYKETDAGPRAITLAEVNVRVERKDAAINDLVGINTKVWKLAEGFQFTEGPVWVRAGKYLLFSDPNANRIYKYTSNGELSVFREKSGYDGADIAEFKQPGSNGLTLDPQGRLTINQHGNRRIIRVEPDGHEMVPASNFEGKRLNSPNDLVYRSDGALFFTDPPFGLPKFHDDPRRELPFEGVFSVFKGKVQLVSKDFHGPNGIAFSPDEKYLYVGNWEDHKKVIMRYDVRPDATLANGRVFFDLTSAPGEDAIDGMKVD